MMAESPIKFFKAHDLDIFFLSLITIKGLCLITMAEVGRRNRFDFVSFYFIMTNYYSKKKSSKLQRLLLHVPHLIKRQVAFIGGKE